MHGNKQFLNNCKTGQHIILNPISIRQISVKYLPISDKRGRKAVHQLLTSSSIAIKVALYFILSFSLKYIIFISLSLKYDIFISLSQKYVLFISIFFSLNMLSLSMKYILGLKIVRKVAIYLYR